MATIITPKEFGAYSFDKYAVVNDCAQLDVYSSSNLFLETIERVDSLSINQTSISLDVEAELKKAGYIAGDFRIVGRLIRNYLGSSDGIKLTIQEISSDRLEVRVLFKPLTTINVQDIQLLLQTNDKFNNWFAYDFFNLDKQSVLANLFLQKSSTDKAPIFDYIQDRVTITNNPWSIIFKLSSSLPTNFIVGDDVWINQEVATPIDELVKVIPPNEGVNLTKIKGPNFNALTQTATNRTTEYKDWDDLLGTSTTQQQLTTNIFSGSSVEGVDLNIDYRKFENFVQFGSAYERLKNFEYKVQLLEYYNSIITNLTTALNGLPQSSSTGSIVFISQSATYTTKKEALIGTFDGFERYMYYGSSSYVSNSFGEFLDMSWPKTGSLTQAGTLSKPYTLMPSTSSYVQNWFEGLLTSASLYDDNNQNALVKLIPAHIRESVGNESAQTYVQMIGHYFDIVYSYVKQMTMVNNRDESLTEGFAKDLVYTIGQSLGIALDNGSTLEDLWSYTLGVDSTGSHTYSSYQGQIQTTAENYSKEIWKRIINNLPYLLRTKGTARGVRALINCFGIPRTILRIKEYGGPEPEFDTTSTADYERFSYGLGVGYPSSSLNKSYLRTSWLSQSRTIELRIKPDVASRSTKHVPIFEIPNQFAITLLQTGSVDRIYFVASQPSVGNWIGFYIEPTASIGNIYDGNWTNIAFSYNTNATGFTGVGYAKRTQYGKVVTASGSVNYGTSVSASLLGPYTTPPVVNIPGTASNTNLSTSRYSGQVQEFRLWSSSLNETTINKHTLAPTSYMSNVTGAFAGNTSSYDDLLFRLSLGSDAKKVDFSTTSSYNSQHPNQTIPRSASFFNFPTNQYTSSVEEYFLEWPDFGSNRQIGNKIRIDNTLNAGSELYRNAKIQKSLIDLYPTDSPRLGIFLSPTDEVNEDIAEQFGGFSIDDYIGDPQDTYEVSYRGLDTLKNLYFKKYPSGSSNYIRNNAQAYINLLKYYDSSLFKLIESFTPERADTQTGLAIESDILHRNKLPITKPNTPEDLDYDTTLVIPSLYKVNGAVQDADGDQRDQPGYVQDGVIDAKKATKLLGDYEGPVESFIGIKYAPEVVGYQNQFNNQQIEEQGSGLNSLTADLNTGITSYGVNKYVYGSKYRFFTWAKTGSGDTDYQLVDALPEDYWNPFGPTITGSRISNNYNSTAFPYNGSDILLGSGSAAYTSVYYTSSALIGLEQDFGFRFTPRPTAVGSAEYWYNGVITGNSVLLYKPNTTNTATLTIPVPADAQRHNVSGVFSLNGAGNGTLTIQIGATVFTYTSTQIGINNPLSISANASGSSQVIITWTPALASSGLYIYKLKVSTLNCSDIQDHHVGEYASVGMKNVRYEGSKLIASDYNVDSNMTVDGGPVITILESNPNDLRVKTPIRNAKTNIKQSTPGGTFEIT